MFPRLAGNSKDSSRGKTGRGHLRSPLASRGYILLGIVFVIQIFTLIFTLCGHGKWIEGKFGSSSLWRECMDVHSSSDGSVIYHSCFRLTMADSMVGYNMARMFLIMSHFFGLLLPVAIVLNILRLSDSMLNDFSKLFSALSQWGLVLLATAMVTSHKNSESHLQNGTWQYACVLSWIAWVLSTIELMLILLFVVWSSKFRV